MLHIIDAILEDDYVQVEHEDLLHLVPEGDIRDHFIPECSCGTKEVAIDGTVVAVVHTSFDKREILNSLDKLDLDTAIKLRKEYWDNLIALHKEGRISGIGMSAMGLTFNSKFENIFRVN